MAYEAEVREVQSDLSNGAAELQRWRSRLEKAARPEPAGLPHQRQDRLSAQRSSRIQLPTDRLGPRLSPAVRQLLETLRQEHLRRKRRDRSPSDGRPVEPHGRGSGPTGPRRRHSEGPRGWLQQLLSWLREFFGLGG